MRLFILAAIALICIQAASAEEYYADITFDIGDSGSTLVSGVTNNPGLTGRQTQEFTSKKGEYWVFNLSVKEPFSNFIYTISLPEGAVINYIKASTPVRIGGEGRTFIKATGKNNTMQVTVQYTLSPRNRADVVLILSLAVAMAFAAAGYFYFRKSKSTAVQSPSGKEEKTTSAGEKPWYDKEFLADRQKEILEIVEKNNGMITQRQLESGMSIPKSSLSRNIDALARKGIIRKESKGMTNVICINKTKPEF